MVNTEREAKAVAKAHKASLYKDVLPLTTGMFSPNTRLSKEKMIATMHRSVLGLTKTGEARPIEDLKLFLTIAGQHGLNPFKNEVYATYMWSSSRGREELTPIVSIHGLRKMARRGGVYTHTGAATVEYDNDGNLQSATVPVFGRWSANSEPVEVTRYTAMYSEFVKLNNKTGEPTGTWNTMPRVMLIKCAEANALRAGFDIAGIYVEEELESNTIVDAEVVNE